MQERILHKAHELFFRYGIRSVSMDEIASQMGISKKTIYQFYADKNALVLDVIDLEIQKAHRDCSYQQQIAENAVHEVFLAIATMNELFATINPSILFDLEKYHPQAYQRFKENHDTYLYQVIKLNLERGIAEGLYRSELNVEILAKYRLGSVYLAFNNDFFAHGKYYLNEIVSVITDNFIYGIVTPKGKTFIEQYIHQTIQPSSQPI